jgi:hypothetical protein
MIIYGGAQYQYTHQLRYALSPPVDDPNYAKKTTCCDSHYQNSVEVTFRRHPFRGPEPRFYFSLKIRVFFIRTVHFQVRGNYAVEAQSVQR